MSKCNCGYTTDSAGNCNGTHKAIKRVKQDIQDKFVYNCLWNKPEDLNCDCIWHLAAAKVWK